MNPRRTAWHTCADGTKVMLFVQRVDYSPETRWEAEPVRGDDERQTYAFRRWGCTREAALAAAGEAWRELVSA
jgi:hypothetical protein